MTITTLSSRDFSQDTGRAKKAAANGPVFVTDRGRPAHARAYRQLGKPPLASGAGNSALEWPCSQ